MTFKYIVSNAKILNGKPIIQGSRISVQLILEWLGNGATENEIVQEYPHISREAIKECLLYASQMMSTDVFYEIEKTIQFN